MAYLNHSLPPFTCYIRNEYLYNHTQGWGQFSLCDVHAVASIEHRVPLFEAFLENGVNWTRRPLNAFCWSKDAKPVPLSEVYYWDCLSPYINVQIRNRLGGLRGQLLTPSGLKLWGDYMFTLDWGWEDKSILDTNFSETPEHKCAHVFKVEDGNFYAYPNNRVIWFDPAWTAHRIQSNPGYLIDSTLNSVDGRRNFEVADKYIYEQSNIPEWEP